VSRLEIEVEDSRKVPISPGGRPVAAGEAESRESRSLAEARKQGEAEAEVVDLALKLLESRTRERRLLETVTELQESVEHLRRVESEVRAQLERYVTFHRDLEKSLGWRFLQSLRRLIGRGW
jgi:hypothetical protein